MAFERLLHLQCAFCRKTGQNGLKLPVFRLKSGTTVAPRENLTRLKVRQVHKTVGLISRLETCMAFERLLHLQCAFCRKTGQNSLKLPVFRLKSGTTVAPRESLTHLKVRQVHKTVGLISRLETCMAFQRLPHLQGVFCLKRVRNGLREPFWRLKSGNTAKPRG